MMALRSVRCSEPWTLIRYLIGHAFEEPRETTFAGNGLYVILGLSAVIMMSIYQGSLLTHLLHPPEVPPFTDSADLVNKIAARQVRTSYVRN